MEVTRVDNAGKIPLPLNISKQCGVAPSTQFAVNTTGNSIIFTKLNEVNPDAEKSKT